VSFFSFEYIYCVYLIYRYIFIYNKKKFYDSVCQYVVDTSSSTRQHKFNTHTHTQHDLKKKSEKRGRRLENDLIRRSYTRNVNETLKHSHIHA